MNSSTSRLYYTTLCVHFFSLFKREGGGGYNTKGHFEYSLSILAKGMSARPEDCRRLSKRKIFFVFFFPFLSTSYDTFQNEKR